MTIHPSSYVSPKAKIGKNVTIGPFCQIYDNVTIGDDCVLHSHVVMGSEHAVVEMGSNNQIYSFTLLGGPPQDLKYKGEQTKLVIGNNNIIRENVTMSIGTPNGRGTTRMGDNCMLMAYVHVGHDGLLGNHVVLANQVQLAGHVIVEDKTFLGGLCAVNQFTRIGKYAYIGGGSWINKDIPHFCMAQGNYAIIRGTNKVGMKRNGFSDEAVENVNRALRILTKGTGTTEEALARIADECKGPEVGELVAFVRSSERGIAL